MISKVIYKWCSLGFGCFWQNWGKSDFKNDLKVNFHDFGCFWQNLGKVAETSRKSEFKSDLKMIFPRFWLNVGKAVKTSRKSDFKSGLKVIQKWFRSDFPLVSAAFGCLKPKADQVDKSLSNSLSETKPLSSPLFKSLFQHMPESLWIFLVIAWPPLILASWNLLTPFHYITPILSTTPCWYFCALALHRWLLIHPRVQDLSQKMQDSRAPMNLILLKSSKLVVVEKESMRSEVAFRSKIVFAFFATGFGLFGCLSWNHQPYIGNSLELEPVMLHGACYILAWSLGILQGISYIKQCLPSISHRIFHILAIQPLVWWCLLILVFSNVHVGFLMVSSGFQVGLHFRFHLRFCWRVSWGFHLRFIWATVRVRSSFLQV